MDTEDGGDPTAAERRPWLLFVTGAPGAGKSSIAKALIASRQLAGPDSSVNVLVFDADWLLEPASALAGRDLTDASALWPQYRVVWLRVLEMVARNGASAALFTPMNPGALPRVRWRVHVDWCLLDCDDGTRIARLQERGWTTEAIEDAVVDARALRSEVAYAIDTSRSTPELAAARVADWFATHVAHAGIRSGHDRQEPLGLVGRKKPSPELNKTRLKGPSQ